MFFRPDDSTMTSLCTKGYAPLFTRGDSHVIWKRLNNKKVEIVFFSGSESKCFVIDISKDYIRRQLSAFVSMLRREYVDSMRVPRSQLSSNQIGPSTRSFFYALPTSHLAPDEPSTSAAVQVTPPQASTSKKLIPLQWYTDSPNFKKRTTFKEQYKAVFGEYPDYTCMQCFKHFTLKHNLTRHEKNVHIGGRKRHQCPVCGATYKHQFHFEDHMRVHDNFIYECGACSEGFESRNALNAHKRKCGTDAPRRENVKEVSKQQFATDKTKKSTGSIRIPIDFEVIM